jgi:hypothetical protein
LPLTAGLRASSRRPVTVSADLSTSSPLVAVDGVGDYIDLERPDLVTELLQGLIA